MLFQSGVLYVISTQSALCHFNLSALCHFNPECFVSFQSECFMSS